MITSRIIIRKTSLYIKQILLFLVFSTSFVLCSADSIDNWIKEAQLVSQTTDSIIDMCNLHGSSCLIASLDNSRIYVLSLSDSIYWEHFIERETNNALKSVKKRRLHLSKRYKELFSSIDPIFDFTKYSTKKHFEYPQNKELFTQIARYYFVLIKPCGERYEEMYVDFLDAISSNGKLHMFAYMKLAQWI